MRVNAKYDEAFRADAVELVLKGERPVSQIAQDLGVNEWTLRGWYYKHPMVKRRRKGATARTAKAGGAETAEEKLRRLERENERLRKENDSLRTDREILKKAAAFFAKENE